MKRYLLAILISAMSVMTVTAQHYGHWSVMGKVGTQKVRGGEWNQAYALLGEYDLSPMWGFGLEGMYILTDRHGKQSFHPKTYLIDAFASINLTNILSATSKKVDVMINAGVGLGFGGGWGFKDWTQNTAPMFHLGPAIEWNINKYFGLGLDLRFIMSSTNRFMGTNDGEHMTSDASFNGYYNGNLYLRYKIAPLKRGSDHMRNIDMTRLRRF